MYKFQSIGLILCLSLITLSSCKKITEPTKYKISNGVIGRRAFGGGFGVDPNTEKSFVYKQRKSNQTYSTFMALNKDQSKFYVQRRDSTGRLYIDEISTFDCKTLRSISFNVSLNDLVYDASQNRLFALDVVSTNTISIQSLNLDTWLWTYHGDFTQLGLFAFSGQNFMRDNKLFIVGYNEIFCYDPIKREMKKDSEITLHLDSKYDPVSDHLYILKNNNDGYTLSRFDFNNGRMADIMTLIDVDEIFQSSMCILSKSKELIMYTSSDQKIIINLDQLSMEVKENSGALMFCKSISNNVEISINDIEIK